ncbi:MAG: hydantoinase B/oxoprolinase family protein [Alphaproteobacteria bacterium]|nr:hydantoinase B/oxoprolinase family protein [Alphaproteobacteria bacterium]
MPETIDSITASVIQGALENIAVEMGHKLMRMSYSSIIRESEDFGAALVDAEGRGLAESAQSTPLQSGPIPGYVRGILKTLAARGDGVRPGDVIMHNDAYAGASHGPDVGFAVPVFHDGNLVAFAATTAHHLDIGALSPGSCGIVDAIDAFAEGLQFKAIKVYDRGARNDAVWQLLRDNIRVSDLVVGDMEAQIAAARIGAERLAALIVRHGYRRFRAACGAVMDYAERLMRQAITALPDGEYRAETRIDGFADSPDPTKRHLPIVATVKVKGDEIKVDLTGTAPQVPDRPINMPFEGTVDVAVWLTIRSVLLDTAVRGHIPVNDGLLRPIKITAPPGTLANPVFPAPTIARFCTGNAVADTVMKALAQAVPGQVSAGIGNLKVIAFSGMREIGHWVHMEIFEGSYGGRNGTDGMDAVDTLYANTRNNPIEDIETHLPLRVSRYELREKACGAGEWRGGLGSVREFEYLVDGGASVEADGHEFAPWAFSGGAQGRPAELHFLRRDGSAQPLPSKVPHMHVEAGDRFVCIGPAGGGYGDPLRRNPALVRDDVADGVVSAAAAQEEYGVVLLASGEVDAARTERLRREMEAARGC